jgi:LCP family protein required for cell wall assembly
MKNPFKRDPDPFAPSRYEGSRVERLRQRKRHPWRWALLSVLTLVVALAGYGIYKYIDTLGKVQEEIEGVTRPANELDPFNALLVGSDSRGDLTPEEQLALGAAAVGGERADTIILAHIDPGDQSVTMVQFPRDLYVPIAGGGEDKINAALQGGPAQLVNTIKQLTGLKIHQYVQVNIAGFRDVVDALGGVSVCITEAIPFDPATGIEVTEEELGMVEFDGDRALRFVRSRRFPSGDFARIANQQKFVAAAINKVTSASTFTSPTRINKLLDVAGENLTIDDNTTLLGVRKLLGRLRSFDPELYEAYVAPNTGIGNINGASVVLPDDEAMDLLFDAIARNESPSEADGVPSVEPWTVTVGVYNGSSVPGAAEALADGLIEATDTGLGPVVVGEIGDADRTTHRKTLVLYGDASSRQKAELVAAALGGATVRRATISESLDVAVVVGNDEPRAEKVIPLVPIELPEPSEPSSKCT